MKISNRFVQSTFYLLCRVNIIFLIYLGFANNFTSYAVSEDLLNNDPEKCVVAGKFQKPRVGYRVLALRGFCFLIVSNLLTSSAKYVNNKWIDDNGINSTFCTPPPFVSESWAGEYCKNEILSTAGYFRAGESLDDRGFIYWVFGKPDVNVSLLTLKNSLTGQHLQGVRMPVRLIDTNSLYCRFPQDDCCSGETSCSSLLCEKLLHQVAAVPTNGLEYYTGMYRLNRDEIICPGDSEIVKIEKSPRCKESKSLARSNDDNLIHSVIIKSNYSCPNQLNILDREVKCFDCPITYDHARYESFNSSHDSKIVKNLQCSGIQLSMNEDEEYTVEGECGYVNKKQTLGTLTRYPVFIHKIELRGVFSFFSFANIRNLFAVLGAAVSFDFVRKYFQTRVSHTGDVPENSREESSTYRIILEDKDQTINLCITKEIPTENTSPNLLKRAMTKNIRNRLKPVVSEVGQTVNLFLKKEITENVKNLLDLLADDIEDQGFKDFLEGKPTKKLSE